MNECAMGCSVSQEYRAASLEEKEGFHGRGLRRIDENSVVMPSGRVLQDSDKVRFLCIRERERERVGGEAVYHFFHRLHRRVVESVPNRQRINGQNYIAGVSRRSFVPLSCPHVELFFLARIQLLFGRWLGRRVCAETTASN